MAIIAGRVSDTLVVVFFLLIRSSQDNFEKLHLAAAFLIISIMLSEQNTYVILCKTLMYIHQEIEKNGKRQWIPPVRNVTGPVYLINTLSKIHKMWLACLLWNLKYPFFPRMLCQMPVDPLVFTGQSAHVEEVLLRKRKTASNVVIISHSHLCKMFLFSEDE